MIDSSKNSLPSITGVMSLKKPVGIGLLLCSVHLALSPSTALAGTVLDKTLLRIETAGVWQGKNDVRIPADGGTRFAIDKVVGDNAAVVGRLELKYAFAGKHQLRLLYAPLRLNGRGSLVSTTNFAGETFPAGNAEVTYQFDSHRLTYRYAVVNHARAQLHLGITALLRDAEIRLRQNNRVARDANAGVVPLLHLAGRYPLSDRVSASFDFDGAVAAQGRALDVGLHLNYALSDKWQVFTGYRVLEGGVDNSDVYNFALFNYALVGASVSF